MSERNAAAKVAQPQRADPQRSAARATSPVASVGVLPSISRLQRAVGNRGMGRLLRGGTIQPKLTVNRPGDVYEREADRIADQVMRMPDPRLEGSIQRSPMRIQRLCYQCEHDHAQQPVATQQSHLQIQRLCPECEKKHSQTGDGDGKGTFVQTKRAGEAPEVSSDVESYLASSGGQPLPRSALAYFEPRFGRDFGAVRVHADSAAALSASAIGARAYTVGQHIVFGSGQFASGTFGGRSLLAHELVHTIQQGHVGHSLGVQRTCDPAPIAAKVGTRGDCADRFDGTFVPGRFFRFNSNCDTFATGQAAALTGFATGQPPATTFEIHGYASVDGQLGFNQDLGCARGMAARTLLTGAGVAGGRITGVINHGPVPGPRLDRIGVVIVASGPPPKVCGPDTTDWFIRQISAAKTDATVLAVKARLAGADRVARRYGFSAQAIAAGGVARKVLAEEARVGLAAGARTPEARSQLIASVPGQREFARALVAAPVPLVGAPELMVLLAIRGAALTWKDLVGTGKKYDFKNDPRTLRSPTSDHCPRDCANTITLCSSTPANCFVKDVPGNLFYAHIGRFVGWTELTLQLGSQFAQLESSARWDPPEDTRMITFGFALPASLTSADLCSAIASSRSVFDIQACANCPEETTAAVV